MNRKVGDTVRIRSKQWIDAQEKSSFKSVHNPGTDFDFMTREMQKYADKLARILRIQDTGYQLDIDNGEYKWQDWMFDPDYRADEPLSAEDAIRAMLDGETLYEERGRACLWDSVHGWFAVMCNSVATLRKIDCFSDLYRSPANEDTTIKVHTILDGDVCLDNTPLSRKEAFQTMLNGEILYDKKAVRYMWSGHSFIADDAGRFYVPGDYPDLYRRMEKSKRPMTRFEILGWANSEASHGWVVRHGDTDFRWWTPQYPSYIEGDLENYQRARLLPDLSGVDESTIQGFEVEGD